VNESSLGPLGVGGRTTMDQQEMAYSRQLYVYNDQVVQGGITPKLGDLFAEAARKFDDLVSAYIPKSVLRSHC
jgi:nuclear pore complex protein Nup93